VCENRQLNVKKADSVDVGPNARITRQINLTQ